MVTEKRNRVENLANNFSVEALTEFFRHVIDTFKPEESNYDYLFDDNKEILGKYEDIKKVGEAELQDSNDIIVIAAKTQEPLSERSSKKRQYEIAKKIIKEEFNDAAIFVFYDDSGNFRFSLIRAEYKGSKRQFTSFKRYTYYVSPKKTNKTFIFRLSKCDWSSLDKIQEAFSVEPVTKEFYTKLQHWYFWAIENSKFPDDAEKEPNGREKAIIRLITRIIFIWFMKVRGLIPEKLFDYHELQEILKDLSEQESTFYKAILQNLFFATLNTKQENRKFRSEVRGHKGYNPDYGNHNVCRYHYFF